MLTISHNTRLIGKVLIEFDTLASTNTRAVELVSNNSPTEGTVISASFQSRGQGQFGSSWISEAGQNITLSIILKPRFLSSNQLFLLNVIASLAVHDLINEMVIPNAHIKWPNDIILQEGKVAGILIQNTLTGTKVSYSVVGIGVNVNQTRFTRDLPDATSIAMHSIEKFKLNEVTSLLLQKFEARYLTLKQGQTDELWSDYHKVLYRKNRKSFFESGDESFEGTLTRVQKDGRLEVLMNDGHSKLFAHKEISFVN